MKVLLIPNNLSDALSAEDIVEIMTKKYLQHNPNDEIVKFPASDGGSGFSELMINLLGGEIIHCQSVDPLGFPISAHYGALDGTAIIDISDVSGIHLLNKNDSDILCASTFGAGLLIKDALDKGYRKIILGMGEGSPSDVGMGLLMALGIEFLDAKGNIAHKGGGFLDRIKKVDFKNKDKRLAQTEIILACDKANYLTGVNGLIYGFVKGYGVSKMSLQLLEQNILSFADFTQSVTQNDMKSLKYGAGAGGSVAGLWAYLDCKVSNGTEVFFEYLNFQEHVKNTNLIITLDKHIYPNSLEGFMSVVIKYAQENNIPVIALGENVEVADYLGIDAVFPMNIKQADDRESAERKAIEFTIHQVSRIINLKNKD
ncbi:glycerate kinase family protein [Sediminitomix flava]|uniref:Glycerate kinase n=1 Tax=Sediminitomix flava TaxID=379075 RepID=A0A315Z674_SEDFL|nr:glycerate kinase [Sediminitomix flava]PWJ38586.1 glycerate kinase [Sediminitomix flava]